MFCPQMYTHTTLTHTNLKASGFGTNSTNRLPVNSTGRNLHFSPLLFLKQQDMRFDVTTVTLSEKILNTAH